MCGKVADMDQEVSRRSGLLLFYNRAQCYAPAALTVFISSDRPVTCMLPYDTGSVFDQLNHLEEELASVKQNEEALTKKNNELQAQVFVA